MGDRSRSQMILQIPARKRRFSMTNVKLPASEFQDHVGEAFDRSLSQPVVIPKHGRPRNVVPSYGEYERLSARDRRAARVEDLCDDELAAIGASEMGHGLEHVKAAPLAGPRPATVAGTLSGECVVRAAPAEAHRRRPHQIAPTRPDAPSEAG
jgi:hypothetical protein